MKPLTPNDLLDIAQYEKQRQEFRSRIIELKKDRRVQVGEFVTLVFENRETVKFQVQEMMRAERIVTDERIQEEVDTYNDLIPGPRELSATVLIEIQEKEQLRDILDRLIGIDRPNTTLLIVGDDRIGAEYEGGHSTESRISAVHYLRFKLTPEQVERFVSGKVTLKLAIEHPNYRAETVVPDKVRQSLAQDLREL